MADIITWVTSPSFIVYASIVGVVFMGLQISAAVMVYAERKVAAFMQQRLGPTRVGPHGLLQPVADILKLFFKEELRPKAADAFLFTLAPIISVATAYVAFAPGAALLRAGLQSGRLGFIALLGASEADELTNSRHDSKSP